MKKILTLPVLFFLLNLNLLAAGNPDEPATNIVRSGFLKNAGQVYDMNGELCPDVLYSMQLNKVTLFVTKHGLTYGMANLVEKPQNFVQNSIEATHEIKEYYYREASRLDMNLVNASIKRENCVEEIIDETNGVVNFYAGGLDENALNLNYVTQLRIRDVYPGIDWLLKIDADKGFKADFVVNAGADVANIKMEYKGATSVSLNDVANHKNRYPYGNI